jgi:hypothetical protein
MKINDSQHEIFLHPFSRQTSIDSGLTVRASHRQMLGAAWYSRERCCSGVIETDMSNFTKTEGGRNLTLEMQALKRIGKPSDVLM